MIQHYKSHSASDVSSAINAVGRLDTEQNVGSTNTVPPAQHTTPLANDNTHTVPSVETAPSSQDAQTPPRIQRIDCHPLISTDDSPQFSSPVSSPSALNPLPSVNSFTLASAVGRDNDVASIGDQPTSPASAFFATWAPRFEACQTLHELEGALGDCALQWRANGPTQYRAGSEPSPTDDITRPTHKPRCQNRQQQKARKRKRLDKKQASRLQTLFNTYPRRAVKEVLGEKSQEYKGSLEDAKTYLKLTYHRNEPSVEELQAARVTFDNCSWKSLSDVDRVYLNTPPNKTEIAQKLKRAVNTAPGEDKLEYRHIKALDPHGRLLEVLYAAVWKLGIPGQWKSSKTILIFKKGDDSDISNFRPISLLSTIYKLFSSVITSKLVRVASLYEWLSPEQKGFLPGVRGIQEHTHILQSAIDDAKANKKCISICWLDLSNAFGSLPHGSLYQLFDSLPLPEQLREILKDIYSNTSASFCVGKSSIKISPSAGVRQGDALSTIVFNLAAEALVRAAKSNLNSGYQLFETTLKTTAYADDIALISSSTSEMQPIIDSLVNQAGRIGLQFNAKKCAQLTLAKGKHSDSTSVLQGSPLRVIKEDEFELYLGIPIGCRLTFRLTTSLPTLLEKLADSLLAPWQKLEVFRAYLLPSLSHQLSSGRVKKGPLDELDSRCKAFLRQVANVPPNNSNTFFYADRSVGGLGSTPISSEADIWTFAKAAQLLDSADPSTRSLARSQLRSVVLEALGLPSNSDPPQMSAFLSGEKTGGLYRVRHGTGRQSFWSLARHAADRLKLQIDVSDSSTSSIITVDDVSVVSAKVVRGLRTAIRARWTTRHLACCHQGRVASGLALDVKSKDIAWMTSWRTGLSFQDWHQIHRARLNLLPVRGRPGSMLMDKNCRHCRSYTETTAHVINGCKHSLLAVRQRHNEVQNIIVDMLRKKGHTIEVDRCFADSTLRPDITISTINPPILIDVAVTWDDPDSIERAYQEKLQKYQHLGQTFPFIIGSLGSWPATTEAIGRELGINPRTWNSTRRKIRLSAIRGSTTIINNHLAYQETELPQGAQHPEDSDDGEDSGDGSN